MRKICEVECLTLSPQGSEIRLRCEVRDGPLHHTSLVWTFRPAGGSEEVVLNQDTTRGGVMIDTWWQEETDSLVSNLTLYRASLQDKGDYSCRLPGPLAVLGNSTVATLHILNTTLTEPVQGEANTVTSLPLLLLLLCDSLMMMI